MDDRPKKRRGPLTWLAGRSRRFWVVVTLLLPVLYVASCGPVVWVNYNWPPDEVSGPIVVALAIYIMPLLLALNSEMSPDWLREGVMWYLDLWA